MAYKIRKTKEFLKNVITTLMYLEKEWGINATKKFQAILDSKTDMLSNDLIGGAQTPKNKEIRKLSFLLYLKIR